LVHPHSAFFVFKQINCPNFFTFHIALFHLSSIKDIANISHVLAHMLRMSYYPSHDIFNKPFVPEDKGRCVALIHDVFDEVRIVAASGVFHIPGYKVCKILYLKQMVDLIWC